ncbi:MAG: DUF2474 family protein [Steroidobacteraceae bacterium]
MNEPGRSSTWTRVVWFVALWAGSVLALGLVALVLRWLLRA